MARKHGVERPMAASDGGQSTTTTRRQRKAQPRAAPSDGARVLAALIGLAGRPETDLARLEHLTGVYERLKAREAEAAFGVALAALQAELPVIDEAGAILGPDGAPVATYATWEDTVEAIRPLLARHGFSLSFRPGRSAAGLPLVTGILRHAAGHCEEGALELPPDTTGGKNALQAIGSSTSYGQRYVARMLLSLASRGADDDGASATLGPEAGEALAEIRAASSPTALADWKRRNRSRLAVLPPADFREVVRCYAEQLRAVAGPASERAA
jgi:hypothetical protein